MEVLVLQDAQPHIHSRHRSPGGTTSTRRRNTRGGIAGRAGGQIQGCGHCCRSTWWDVAGHSPPAAGPKINLNPDLLSGELVQKDGKAMTAEFGEEELTSKGNRR